MNQPADTDRTYGYNSFYQARPGVFGDEPDPLVTKALEYIQRGSALDVGAGQGRNTLPIADHGLEVLAVDVADAGLDDLVALAASQGLVVQTQLLDIATEEPQGQFDLVVSSLVLHHFSPAVAQQVIATMQTHTNPGGLNVIRTFVAGSPYAKRDAALDRFYPEPDQMLALYSEWEILASNQANVTGVLKDEHGEYYVNQTIDLLARKLNQTEGSL